MQELPGGSGLRKGTSFFFFLHEKEVVPRPGCHSDNDINEPLAPEEKQAFLSAEHLTARASLRSCPSAESASRLSVSSGATHSTKEMIHAI